MTETPSYPARLQIDYPEKLQRLSSFFRCFWIIPIGIVLGALASQGETVRVVLDQSGKVLERSTQAAGGIAAGLAAATMLMILFRQRYPRWWFDFAREFTRFSARVGAYALLLTDVYPSTEDEQAVHLEVDYPDVQQDLQRGMPLIKWFLAIPHYIVLAFLAAGEVFVWIIAWFAILFTERYPRSLFDYTVGLMRWGLRVNAYVALLVTDKYPPFSMA